MPLNTPNPGSAPVLDLPSLPVEILHEITTHLCDVPVPCSEYRVLCCTYLERTDTLHALSVTCRRLRSVFLEPYWEHLEVCASQKVSDAYIYAGFHYNRGFGFALWSLELSEDFARELLQKMTVVTRRPELAVHVRTVSVVLPVQMVHGFVQSLALLPNVSTIQVLWSSTHAVSKYLRRALEPHTFYAVRTLVLHAHAFTLVESCPNLEHLMVYAHWDRMPQLSDLPSYAPSLLTFTCLPLGAHLIQDLVALLPNLVEIPLIRTDDLTPDILKLLKKMENLRRIDLVADYAQPAAGEPRPDTQGLIAAAKEVLCGGPVRLFGPSGRTPLNQSNPVGSRNMLWWCF